MGTGSPCAARRLFGHLVQYWLCEILWGMRSFSVSWVCVCSCGEARVAPASNTTVCVALTVSASWLPNVCFPLSGASFYVFCVLTVAHVDLSPVVPPAAPGPLLLAAVLALFALARHALVCPRAKGGLWAGLGGWPPLRLPDLACAVSEAPKTLQQPRHLTPRASRPHPERGIGNRKTRA